MRRNRPFSGFTLIEVLVVIAIIGLLMALLIPALNSSRESGRRTTCMNNCDQIQKAIITFASKKGRFPYLNTTLPGTTANGYVTAGWVPQILADLGRNDLYQIYDSNAAAGGYIFNAGGATSGPVGNQFIQYLETMVCPSDTAKPMTNLPLPVNASAATIAVASAAAPLSYAVNAGFVDVHPTPGYPPDYLENGIFFSQASSLMALRVLQIPPQPPVTIDLAYIGRYDGASTTILFGENLDATFWAQYNDNVPGGLIGVTTPSNGYPTVLFGPFASYSVPNTPGQNPAGAVFGAYNFEDPQALTWQDLPDMGQSQPTIGLNQGYNGIRPGDPALWTAVGTLLSPGYISRPSSAHPGGFLMTFCDGHTTFVSQDMPYQLYAAMMTPRGVYARVPGSGAVAPPTSSNPNPSPSLLQWQTVPVSTSALNP